MQGDRRNGYQTVPILRQNKEFAVFHGLEVEVLKMWPIRQNDTSCSDSLHEIAQVGSDRVLPILARVSFVLNGEIRGFLVAG